MSIYVGRGLEFSPRTFLPVKGFAEALNYCWRVLKLMPLRWAGSIIR